MRKEPDEEMKKLAESWGVNLLHRVKGVEIVDSLSEAKRLVGKRRALFVREVDPALLSLARQKGTMIGFLLSEISEKNFRRFVEIVRMTRLERVPILLATGAKNVLEMRHPLDVASIGALLGMDRVDAVAAVSKRWRWILEDS